MIRRGFFAKIVALSLFFLIYLPAARGQNGMPYDYRGAEDGNILFRDSEDFIRQRYRWFRFERLGENGVVPTGAREEAWLRSKAMPIHKPAAALAKGTGGAWALVGPNNIGGRVTGVAIHPTNPDIVYFTAADGGIWKSTDGGAHFTPVADDLPTMAMGSIDIDPTNPDIIYVGTGEANGSADSYPGIGVVKSTDAGATWFPIGGAFAANIGKIRVHRTDPAIVLAAARQGMYRSTDSARTWKRVISGVVHDVLLHPTNPNLVFAAVQGIGVMRSEDSGATWTQLDIGVRGDSVGRLAIDLCLAQPDIMYAVIVNGKGTSSLKAIVKTTDGGHTWFKTSSSSTPNFFSTYGWYLCDIAVHPTNPDRILSGGVGLYMSTDGGYSWTARSGIHVDQHAIEFSPSHPDIMYLGNDGGMYKSINGGTTYSSLNADLPITQFYELGIALQNPELMGGGTQDNGTKIRRSPGVSWGQALGGDGGYFVIDYTDTNYMWGEYQYGNHTRTTDGGKTWISANTGLFGNSLWVAPVAIHPTNPQVLFTATTKQLYKTTNRGERWFPFHGNMDSSSSINVITVSPKNPSRMLVGYTNGRVWVTEDGGIEWFPISNGLPSRTCKDLQFDPKNDSTFYACYSGYASEGVFRTTNRGASWVSIAGNLPAIPKNALEIDPINPANIFVGTDLGVYATTDSGRTWNILGTGMPKCVIADLEIHPRTGMLLAATHGRSVYQLAVTTPVEFASFSAVQEGDAVRLTWRTTSETGNAGFFIERNEPTANAWDEIGFVEGRGSTIGFQLYTFVDRDLPPHARTLVYRLKQIDTDGSFGYSPEATVTLSHRGPDDFVLEQNFPNPFNPVTTIVYRIPATGDVRLSVTDALGRERSVLVDERKSAGTHAVHFDASGMESGPYFYHLEYEKSRLSRSMVVLK
ncbi:MAG: T9SS type A sorting domain-containing protein [Bacteroidota bacterium]|nr:T9SS type A sorting domain-containing protein [Bacteroidota bacterium]